MDIAGLQPYCVRKDGASANGKCNDGDETKDWASRRPAGKWSGEVFVPLEHRPGEAQVDFGQALVQVGGVLQKVSFFVFSAAV